MVVIFTILSENAANVVFIQYQDMVETFFTNRAYPLFCLSLYMGINKNKSPALGV